MRPAPYLSVVVPAFNGTRVLREALPSLMASDLPRDVWELVVVDDGSTDNTAEVAAEYADVVVRLPGRARGPAYARNRGVEASRGEVIVFIDADVCVHPETLRKIADAFRTDAGMASLFGSYDAEPTAPGIISQFRNLLHHFVHHGSPGDAETFWAGCGAVRREAFFDVGGMDAWHFPRPQIEDIEFGRRLRRRGYRIVLRPDIQCTHLKHWTLRNMITTDFRDRGTPWMWLILSEGATATPATLNLKLREKICTALVAVAALCIAGALVFLEAWLLLPAAAAIITIVAINASFYRFLIERRGILFAACALPLHLIFYFTGGCAAIAGMFLHATRGVPVPPEHVRRETENHDGSWPPPVDRPRGSVWAVQ